MSTYVLSLLRVALRRGAPLAVMLMTAAALGADSGFTVAQRTLAWSKPVRVTNDFGKVRLLHTAPATPVFWQLWRTNKTAMRAAGFSARPTTNGWEALYWKEVK